MEKVEIGRATLYCGDCREVLAATDLSAVDLVLTDPPYPNNAGHFVDDISAAEEFMAAFECGHWMVFWDELTTPPVPQPLVAKHIWHRNNTNRPDNYEPIYHFHMDGKRRASRVLPYPVVYPGLTGCTEATGHPTQKNVKLMKRLVQMASPKLVLDPFFGSGATIAACQDMEVPCIGIEKDRRYFDIACERIHRAQQQLKLAL